MNLLLLRGDKSISTPYCVPVNLHELATLSLSASQACVVYQSIVQGVFLSLEHDDVRVGGVAYRKKS